MIQWFRTRRSVPACRAALAAQAFPNVTAEQAARIEDLWLELQRELAGRSSHERVLVAERSGHYVHYEEPGLVIQAIRVSAGSDQADARVRRR